MREGHLVFHPTSPYQLISLWPALFSLFSSGLLHSAYFHSAYFLSACFSQLIFPLNFVSFSLFPSATQTVLVTFDGWVRSLSFERGDGEDPGAFFVASDGGNVVKVVPDEIVQDDGHK